MDVESKILSTCASTVWTESLRKEKEEVWPDKGVWPVIHNPRRVHVTLLQQGGKKHTILYIVR